MIGETFKNLGLDKAALSVAIIDTISSAEIDLQPIKDHIAETVTTKTVNHVDSNGNSALLLACGVLHFGKKFTSSRVKTLLALGAKTDIKNFFGFSALHVANSENISLLLEHGAKVDESLDIPDSTLAHFNKEFFNLYQALKGATPLCFAARRGHLDEIELLIQNKADINATTACGLSPIIFAIIHGHFKIVKFLLNEGANPNQTLSKPVNPSNSINFMDEIKKDEVLKVAGGFNTKNVENYNTAMLAVLHGYEDIACLLLDDIDDLNHQAHDGHTLLSLAAKNGMIKLVKALLEKNVELDALAANTPAKATSLALAIKHEHYEIADLLISAGASVNALKPYTVSPLLSACARGSIELVKTLIEKGADPNFRLGTQSPLSTACTRNHSDIVNYLLENKAIPIKDDLNMSIMSNNLKFVKLFLKHNQQLKLNKSSVSLAIQKGDVTLVKYILDVGKFPVDINLKDPFNPIAEDKNPLQLACQLHKPDIVEYLMEQSANPLLILNQAENNQSVLSKIIEYECYYSLTPDTKCLEKILEVHIINNSGTINNFDELIKMVETLTKRHSAPEIPALLKKYQQIQQERQETSQKLQSANEKHGF